MNTYTKSLTEPLTTLRGFILPTDCKDLKPAYVDAVKFNVNGKKVKLVGTYRAYPELTFSYYYNPIRGFTTNISRHDDEVYFHKAEENPVNISLTELEEEDSDYDTLGAYLYNLTKVNKTRKQIGIRDKALNALLEKQKGSSRKFTITTEDFIDASEDGIDDDGLNYCTHGLTMPACFKEELLDLKFLDTISFLLTDAPTYRKDKYFFSTSFSQTAKGSKKEKSFDTFIANLSSDKPEDIEVLRYSYDEIYSLPAVMRTNAFKKLKKVNYRHSSGAYNTSLLKPTLKRVPEGYTKHDFVLDLIKHSYKKKTMLFLSLFED